MAKIDTSAIFNNVTLNDRGIAAFNATIETSAGVGELFQTKVMARNLIEMLAKNQPDVLIAALGKDTFLSRALDDKGLHWLGTFVLQLPDEDVQKILAADGAIEGLLLKLEYFGHAVKQRLEKMDKPQLTKALSAKGSIFALASGGNGRWLMQKIEGLEQSQQAEIFARPCFFDFLTEKDHEYGDVVPASWVMRQLDKLFTPEQIGQKLNNTTELHYLLNPRNGSEPEHLSRRAKWATVRLDTLQPQDWENLLDSLWVKNPLIKGGQQKWIERKLRAIAALGSSLAAEPQTPGF